MSTLTVTRKGQVTLRKDILMHMGVRAGEKIDIDLRPGGEIVVKAARPGGSISSVFNALKSESGPVLTLDEINALTAKGWAGER